MQTNRPSAAKLQWKLKTESKNIYFRYFYETNSKKLGCSRKAARHIVYNLQMS